MTLTAKMKLISITMISAVVLPSCMQAAVLGQSNRESSAQSDQPETTLTPEEQASVAAENLAKINSLAPSAYKLFNNLEENERKTFLLLSLNTCNLISWTFTTNQQLKTLKFFLNNFNKHFIGEFFRVANMRNLRAFAEPQLRILLSTLDANILIGLFKLSLPSYINRNTPGHDLHQFVQRLTTLTNEQLREEMTQLNNLTNEEFESAMREIRNTGNYIIPQKPTK